jgi:hypothetical protein
VNAPAPALPDKCAVIDAGAGTIGDFLEAGFQHFPGIAKFFK